jgi:hypothetical protein
MFNLPNQAFIDKFLPKKTFEEKVINGKKVFKDISKITLKYKLSPNTINIEKTQNIAEILIFEIILNEKNIPKNAIKTIDELVVFPKLYVFKYKDEFCYGVFYKEEKKYFFSNWNETKEFNFNHTNLEKVYENLIKIFFKSEASTIQNDFKKSFQIENKIQNLKKEIEVLENKIKKEKQFKNKLLLSGQLTPLKTKLQTIQKELNE